MRSEPKLLALALLAALAAGAGTAAATPEIGPVGRDAGSLFVHETAPPPVDGWESRSPLALAPSPSPTVAAGMPQLRWFGRGGRTPKPAAEPAAAAPPKEPSELGAERARTLLRSMVFPGWGQAAMGHRTSGAIFALAETGVWASFAAFRIQQQMRRETYEHTAKLYAGISLDGRDEEFRRLVGAYLSSDDYNRLVVYRDAANLYYDDPAAYRQYIAEHELKGADTWSWSSEGAILDYRGQRKDTQRAALRANTALAAAVINRLLCTLHAARFHSHADQVKHSWNLEVSPGPGTDATAFRATLRRSF